MASQLEHLLFREITKDDRKKVEKASNVATTGGGARDFRFPVAYKPVLSSMFPRVVTKRGKQYRVGDIHFVSARGDEISHDVAFWPEPTKSRSSEVRIGQIPDVAAFADPPLVDGERVFLELAKFTDGQVVAKYVTEASLRDNPPSDGFLDSLDNAIARTSPKKALVFSISVIPPSGTTARDLKLSEVSPPAIHGVPRKGREISFDQAAIDNPPPDANDADGRLVEAIYNYEKHEHAGSEHKRTLQALSEMLKSKGLTPHESNIDAYVVKSPTGIMFEVKSIENGNEREQTRRAIGQLLDYTFFERPDGIETREAASLAIVYNREPTEETIAFLESLGFLVLWRDAPEDTISGTEPAILAIEQFSQK